MTANHSLAFSFLGRFEVCRNGLPVVGISYGKMKALLAYLVMERSRAHRREYLASLLWSSAAPEVARGNLRRTLADLRRVLEPPGMPDLFESTKQTIRFLGGGAVDALLLAGPPEGCATSPPCYGCTDCVTHLVEVAARYGGDFLDDLSLADCPEFEDWLHGQREALKRRQLSVLEQLSGHYERSGKIENAIVYARQLVALDPWLESGHRNLIRLLALSGQKGAAVAQYEHCRQTLQRDLGLVPAEETEALMRAVSSGRIEAALPAAPVVSMATSLSIRRQVTVLYCEILAPQIDDPEDALLCIGEPEQRCSALLASFGGHLVQPHGGGLLAYFGYPEAREDAARAAVDAALALRDAAAPLMVRCGVHTGPIVTSPERPVPDVAGQTSSKAILLRMQVGNNQVAVSETTRRLVDGYFHGAMLPSPGGAFRIDGRTGAAHRLEATSIVSPFVGRQPELEALRRHWISAKRGKGGVVVLSGEPGVGKSRLVAEFIDRQTRSRAEARECRCVPGESASPFHPLLQWMERQCGFSVADGAEEKTAKFVRTFSDDRFGGAEGRRLVASLAGLETPDLAPVPRGRGEQRKLLLNALAEMSLAADKPLLIVVEDLHWADSSTIELLHQLAMRVRDRSVLVLLTTRPEFETGNLAHACIGMERLPENAARELAERLPHGLSAQQLQRVVALSDGIPLFIEELVRWSACRDEDGGSAEIPLTLHDLLMARVDQLGPAMRTAQIAAVIGRDFDSELLEPVLAEDGSASSPALHGLLHSGLVFSLGNGCYQFKHALVQEVAYQSLPKSQRQRAHRAVAQVLERDFPELCRRMPAILAHHLTESGEVEAAIGYWLQAGQAAGRFSGDNEAARHYRRALQLIPALPPTAERNRTEMALQLALGTTLNAVLGYAAPETRQAFSRAQELAAAVGSSDEQFRTLYGMWTSHANHATAKEVSELLIRIAEAEGNAMHLAMAHFANLSTTFWMCPLPESIARAERVIDLCRQVDSRQCISVFGENPLSCALSFLSRALWFVGDAARARRVSDEALREARQAGFPHGLCWALAFACQLHRFLRSPATVATLADELIRIAEEHDLLLWRLAGDCHAGWAGAAQGDAAAVMRIERGVERIRHVLPMIEVSYATILMDAYALLDMNDELLREMDPLIDTATQRNDIYLLPELLRLKGRALLAVDADATAPAKCCFDEARRLAQSSGATALALRVAVSRLAIKRDRASLRELRDIVAALGDRFDSPDYNEALAQLAG